MVHWHITRRHARGREEGDGDGDGGAHKPGDEAVLDVLFLHHKGKYAYKKVGSAAVDHAR